MESGQHPQAADDTPLDLATGGESTVVRAVEMRLRVGDVVPVKLGVVADPEEVLSGTPDGFEHEGEPPAVEHLGKPSCQLQALAPRCGNVAVESNGATVGWRRVVVVVSQWSDLRVVEAEGDAVSRRPVHLGVGEVRPAGAQRREVGDLRQARAGAHREGEEDGGGGPHRSRSNRYAASWRAAVSPSKAT